MFGADSGDSLDPLIIMAYLAAVTDKIRLLSSILVIPHRPPVFTAKALARARRTVGLRGHGHCGIVGRLDRRWT